MKTIAMTLALLAGLPLAASAQVTKEDIKKLTSAGISDDVILSYVKANGGVAKLSAEDLVELKQAGASEKLLTTVLAVPAESRPAPSACTSDRCQRFTRAPPPRALLGSSRTMLHTSLSAKVSCPVNCRSFSAPAASKKNGSLRQPAKKR